MVLRGKVREGVVIPEEPGKLPDGADVEIHIPPSAGQPTLYERLKPVIGIVKGLPADLAENHDHYLHGRPKRPNRRLPKAIMEQQTPLAADARSQEAAATRREESGSRHRSC